LPVVATDEALQRNERQTAAIVKNAGPSEFPGGTANAPVRINNQVVLVVIYFKNTMTKK
jgi:hypothetical protein